MLHFSVLAAHVLASASAWRLTNWHPPVCCGCRTTCTQVWRKREKRKLARVQSQCGAQVAALKRKVQHGRPTSEVRLQAEVAFLKRELAKGSSSRSSLLLYNGKQTDAVTCKPRPTAAVEKSFQFTEAGAAYASARRELMNEFEEDPPVDPSWLGQLGATLVAWLGRCVMDLMDDLVRGVLSAAQHHRYVMSAPSRAPITKAPSCRMCTSIGRLG
jgi:hypothetical protein